VLQIPKAFRFLWADKADDGSAVRYRATHGGRGSAKSHSYAQALILKAAEKPLRVGCYREIQKSIRDSVKRLLDDKIKDSGLADFYRSTDTEISGDERLAIHLQRAAHQPGRGEVHGGLWTSPRYSRRTR
jgi:phage terminase large subunit